MAGSPRPRSAQSSRRQVSVPGDGGERSDRGRARRGSLAVIDLCRWVWDEFVITIPPQTGVSRELRAMGYRKLSARPRHHAQASGAIKASKKWPVAAIAPPNGLNPSDRDLVRP